MKVIKLIRWREEEMGENKGRGEIQQGQKLGPKKHIIGICIFVILD
jgi:hypothetical protein